MGESRACLPAQKNNPAEEAQWETQEERTWCSERASRARIWCMSKGAAREQNPGQELSAVGQEGVAGRYRSRCCKTFLKGRSFSSDCLSALRKIGTKVIIKNDGRRVLLEASGEREREK